MDRIDELEERVMRIENSNVDTLTHIDNRYDTNVKFTAQSYEIEIDVDVMSKTIPTIDIVLNGKTNSYNSNFVSVRLNASASNVLTVRVKGEGLLSKKIRISGIGVRLSRE